MDNHVLSFKNRQDNQTLPVRLNNILMYMRRNDNKQKKLGIIYE